MDDQAPEALHARPRRLVADGVPVVALAHVEEAGGDRERLTARRVGAGHRPATECARPFGGGDRVVVTDVAGEVVLVDHLAHVGEDLVGLGDRLAAPRLELVPEGVQVAVGTNARVRVRDPRPAETGLGVEHRERRVGQASASGAPRRRYRRCRRPRSGRRGARRDSGSWTHSGGRRPGASLIDRVSLHRAAADAQPGCSRARPFHCAGCRSCRASRGRRSGATDDRARIATRTTRAWAATASGSVVGSGQLADLRAGEERRRAQLDGDVRDDPPVGDDLAGHRSSPSARRAPRSRPASATSCSKVCSWLRERATQGSSTIGSSPPPRPSTLRWPPIAGPNVRPELGEVGRRQLAHGAHARAPRAARRCGRRCPRSPSPGGRP